MGKFRRFYINIWNRCDLNCRHCFIEGGQTPGQVLSFPEVARLIAAARESLGIEEVQLTGGEPTQRPDIFPLIRLLLKRDLKVLLQTNGVFNSDIAGEILRLPGDNISLIISIDGIATNDYFRGKGGAERVLVNIRRLYRSFRIRLNILLSALIQWEEIEELAGWAQEFNLTLAFNPVCPIGRASAEMLMPPQDYFETMYRLEELRGRGIRIRKCFDVINGQLKENENCPVRFGNTIFIAADGNAYPCGFLLNNPEVYIGTARDSTIDELMARLPKQCRELSAQCRACEFYKNQFCHGGCPARIYGLYQRFDEPDIYCLKSVGKRSGLIKSFCGGRGGGFFKKSPLITYRARTEWNGIELFDRREGRVIAPDQARLYQEELQKGNIEPVIDTPYPKTSVFASAPRRVYWELTRKCDLNCKACFNRFDSLQEELSTKELLNISVRLYRAGVYEIRCTGGEPTVRPDFFEIVAELANLGFYLSMGTNGMYSQDTLQKVMAAPLQWIILSLDGSNGPVHDAIRGCGTFQKALNTLAQLAEKKCRLRINTLIRKGHYTYDQLKGLAEIADRYNVESLNCIPLRPVTRDPGALELQLTALEFKEFIQGLSRLREEHRTDFVTTLDLRQTGSHDRIYFKERSCAAGREGAVISPYGEIYGCSYSLASDPNAPKEQREKFVAGNLLEEEFLKIWNQSERWAIYRDLDRYKHGKCKTCDYYIGQRCIGNCPIMDKDNPAAFDPYCYLYMEE